MTSRNVLNRYLFEDLHARGELVQLSTSYQQMIANHNYPEGVRILLGELMAATCLLTATIKFEGDITVQLQGDGPVAYMSMNGNNNQEMRGIARVTEDAQGKGLKALIGKGNMIITIRPKNAEAYQGVVALEKETLADCLAHYFDVSEQIATKIWLFSDDENQQVAGSLIQLLPASDEADGGDKDKKEADFEHLCQLTNTIKPQEIFELEAETLLYRLYNQEQVRVFEPEQVSFVCGCSAEKCLTAIAQIEPSEIKSIIEEQGNVSMTCDYCLTTYAFDEVQLASYIAETKH